MSIRIEIQGIGIVEVPDEFSDLTQEEKDNYVRQIKQQIENEKTSQTDAEIESTAEDLSFIEKFQGGLRGFAQGLSFGFADEIEAGLRTGVGLFDDYDKTVKEIRKEIDEVRKKSPTIAYASEIGGALLPSLAAGLFTGGTGTVAGLGSTGARIAATTEKAARAAKTAIGTKKAKQAEAVTKNVSDPSLLKSVAQSTAIGAGYGGLYGAGTAEEGERITEALTGAAFGGAISGVVPIAGQVGLVGLKRLGTSFGLGGKEAAEKFSDIKILQALERDGLSKQSAIEKLQAAEKLGQKDILIADLGEDLAQLGYGSQAIAGADRKKVNELLQTRGVSQSERISDAIVDQTKLKGPFNLDYIDELAAIQDAAADIAYKKAYKISVPTNTAVKHTGIDEKSRTIKLSDFFTGPRKEVVIQASKDGQKMMRAKGIESTNLATILKNEESTKEFLKTPIPTLDLHMIKRGFDSIIAKNTDAFGRVNPYGAAVTDTKNLLNKIIEKRNPVYKKANKDYSDIARLKDAFNIGIGQKRMSDGMFRKILKNFNEAEQEAFRVGLVARFKDQSEKASYTQDFTKTIFGSKKKQDLVELAFPKTPEGKQGFQNFKNIIDLEKAKLQTKTKVIGLSPTAARQEAIAEAAIDPTTGVIGRALAGDIPGAVREATAKIGERATGLSPEGAQAVARKLFLLSPQEQIKYLNTLGATERELVQKSLRAIALQTEVSAGAAVVPQILTE